MSGQQLPWCILSVCGDQQTARSGQQLPWCILAVCGDQQTVRSGQQRHLSSIRWQAPPRQMSPQLSRSMVGCMVSAAILGLGL